MLIHTVKRGETLYSIANLYGVSPELLALNNDITGTLVVGDDLVILFPKQTHTVTQGETISSIAELYGVSERRIYQNNYYLLINPLSHRNHLLRLASPA